MKLFARSLALLVLAVSSGCTNTPATPADRKSLEATVGPAIDQFTSTDPALKGLMASAAGYAVFPEIGKGGVIVGGAFGRGQLFERGTMVGYCSLSQATIGAQLGGQTFSELILFKDQAALINFKASEYAFSSNATAVAIKPGAAAVNNYHDGVAVYIHIKGGLMAEASIGGQKIQFEPK